MKSNKRKAPKIFEELVRLKIHDKQKMRHEETEDAQSTNSRARVIQIHECNSLSCIVQIQSLKENRSLQWYFVQLDDCV